jgi:hypothetical protein
MKLSKSDKLFSTTPFRPESVHSDIPPTLLHAIGTPLASASAMASGAVSAVDIETNRSKIPIAEATLDLSAKNLYELF